MGNSNDTPPYESFLPSCNLLFCIDVMTRELRLMLLIVMYQLQIFITRRGWKGTQMYIFSFCEFLKIWLIFWVHFKEDLYKCLKTEVYMPSTVWLMCLC